MPKRDSGSISRHRLSEAPGETYTRTILEPSYQFMLKNYFEGLLETHEAWIVMLAEQGIVTPEAATKVADGLATMRQEGNERFVEFDSRYEYFYSHLEQRLTELVGPEVAGDINIARTRPEPLTRLAVRTRTARVVDRLLDLVETMLRIAEAEKDSVMPQWTHLQPAQPSTVGHYLAGVADALLRDAGRLQAAYATTNRSTLGCGALAGTSYPIDRDRVAALLGFDGVRENSIDAVGSGDYATETAAALGGVGTNLSRLSTDLYLWCTVEFGFAEIGDSYAGSSSMMPQKKNAYPFEYVRARAARAVSDMSGVFMVLHNTTFGDIKDVEEEMVPPVLRLLDETAVSLELLAGSIDSLQFHRESMAKAAAAGFSTATELAAVIHRTTDLDFRSAHKVVGTLVRLAVEREIAPEEVGAALVDEAADLTLGHQLGMSDEDVSRSLDARSFVAAHRVEGGAAPEMVSANVSHARERAMAVRTWLDASRTQVHSSDAERQNAIRRLAE
ncbi:argininosuccinate lyase [Aeromicrobium sp. CTD01-1L150]|uniref:argininosuccinate lyase n=1 Tax=Aeromicrobium sp. CTD01-1L150 TaxID=3341830 RepID=UPI0035C20B44